MAWWPGLLLASVVAWPLWLRGACVGDDRARKRGQGGILTEACLRRARSRTVPCDAGVNCGHATTTRENDGYVEREAHPHIVSKPLLHDVQPVRGSLRRRQPAATKEHHRGVRGGGESGRGDRRRAEVQRAHAGGGPDA
eukprot:scaffold115227_cov57-Phaeocystis_antarctica.AAC.1